jgi:tyrosine-specific transport protein
LIGGTLLTALFYLVWEVIVLGTVPSESLAIAMEQGEPATAYYTASVSSPTAAWIAQFFAFFALVTSFLGMGLGLTDFLSDSLKISKKGWGFIILGLLVIVPTAFFAGYLERVFARALDATGAYGDTILNGMIPVMMVWVLRYRRNQHSSYQLWGGRTTLAVVFAFFFVVLAIDLITPYL